MPKKVCIVMVRFHLRKARKEDVRNIFLLSNDDVVRLNSINRKKISWEEHVKWFNDKLKDPFYVIYVVSDDEDHFLGQVKFEILKDIAVISISISPDFRGRGLGRYVLKSACEKFHIERPDIKEIEAIIRPSNLPSIKIFEYAGFKYKEDITINDEKFLKYVLVK